MHTMLTLTVGLLAAATPRDTTITVRGILQIQLDSAGRPARAVLVLPDPVTLVGHSVNALLLSGDPAGWRRYDSHYVGATGAAGAATPGGVEFQPARVREVEPEGAVGRMVSLSFSQRALVSLSVLPRRFAWQVQGRPSGATPVALFRIGNHGETELDFEFASNEFVCVSVRAEEESEPHWRYQWRYPRPDSRLSVRVGTVFWAMIPLPREALPGPGRYTVRASLCGVPDYQTEATVEVTG